MINRRSVVYVPLPEELVKGKKSKEAKLEISINVTVPRELETKKTADFIDDAIGEVANDFKKYIKKRSEKILKD